MRRCLTSVVRVVSGMALLASWAAPARGRAWVSAWGGRGPLSSTITTNHTFTDPVPNLSGRTLRVMAHLTTGGSQVRVRLSQRFGSAPLAVGAAHVALRGSGSGIVGGTDRALTFAGASSVTVPAGARRLERSDRARRERREGPRHLRLHSRAASRRRRRAGADRSRPPTTRPGTRCLRSRFPSRRRTRQVFVVYEVQVLSPGPAASIVALGDSITEGACSNVDANGDWPDLLAARLPALADGTAVAVFNAGIGSGRFAVIGRGRPSRADPPRRAAHAPERSLGDGPDGRERHLLRRGRCRLPGGRLRPGDHQGARGRQEDHRHPDPSFRALREGRR